MKWPERDIRHDIPLTNMIRRAFAAGTRDSGGRPGSQYWQTWMDHTINARLDSATHVVAGHEFVVFHNNSPDSISTIRVRLDQNVFEPRNVRARVVEEVTDGMKLSKLTVNGLAVDLNGGGQGRPGPGRRRPRRSLTTCGRAPVGRLHRKTRGRPGVHRRSRLC